MFSIYKGNKKNFYVDASGNLHFEGDLTGATGTFSGLLSGGSINIGNGTFTVDKNGSLYASSGTFCGELKGASGTFSGKLEAASGTFSGELVAAHGTFAGTLSAGVSIESPTINGGTITGVNVNAVTMNILNAYSGG